MRISDWSSDVCSSDLWQGRLTEIIKTGGANVSPLEIDDVLAMYPGIRRAQTGGVPHDTLSEMVVSCVVPQAGVALAEAAIREFLKALTDSTKTPRSAMIFRRDALPVTPNTKDKPMHT